MSALASMTAYARVAAVLPQGTAVWEIKTVNNKGLDLRLRLPPGFDAQDAACRERLSRALTRGSVQATLTLQRKAATPQVRVDGELLRSLIEAVTAAVPPGSSIAPPTLDGLLTVRGVVDIGEQAESETEHATLASAALDLLDQAVRDVQSARRSEGMALGTVLQQHLEAIGALTEAADAAPGRQPGAIMARLTRSVEALVGASPALDPARLHQEAILIATRADVREEIDRLRMHREAAATLLRAGGPVGRRLDFLAQELGREANTLCAKSGDAGLTAIGLDLRTRIEQFREQVQNLE